MACSGFFAWWQRQQNPGPRAQENAVITAQAQVLFERHRGFYGALRIHQELRVMAYLQLLEDRKISCSMSAKCCCWDNAVVESFFSTFKQELILDDDGVSRNSPQQLVRHLVFSIDSYYNRERRHSSIGYLSPIDQEEQFINTSTFALQNPRRPPPLPTERANSNPQSLQKQKPLFARGWLVCGDQEKARLVSRAR